MHQVLSAHIVSSQELKLFALILTVTDKRICNNINVMNIFTIQLYSFNPSTFRICPPPPSPTPTHHISLVVCTHVMIFMYLRQFGAHKYVIKYVICSRH